jgi:hypothetical protein
MARQRSNPFPDCENVEAIAAGVALDPNSPTGEWFVGMGSVWRTDSPVVALHPEWVHPIGHGADRPALPARLGQLGGHDG